MCVWRLVFGGLVDNLCFRTSFECVYVKFTQTTTTSSFSVRNAVFNPPTQRNSTKAYQIKSHIQQKLELTQTDQSGSLQRPTANKDERERERRRLEEGEEEITVKGRWEGLVDLIEPNKACVCLILNLSVNTQAQLTRWWDTADETVCTNTHSQMRAESLDVFVSTSFCSSTRITHR